MNDETGSSVSVDPVTGMYSIEDLPAGDYRVQFATQSYWDEATSEYVTPNLVSEYYNDTIDYSASSVVTVTAGSTRSGINATLAKGARITGKITLPAGEPAASLKGVTVSADGPSFAHGIVDASTGNYEIVGLAAGEYRVTFTTTSYWDESASTDVAAPNLVTQYYNGTADWNAADLVAVSAGGMKSGINAQLVKGAKISGKVTLPSGEPITSLRSIRVTAESTSNDTYVQPVGVDPVSGAYTLTGLGAGDYRIRFSAESYWDDAGEKPAPNLVPEYYNDVTDASTAVPISVTEGAARTGINATLARGASLSGKVSLPSGEPATSLRNITVIADGPIHATAQPDPSTGAYTITGLAAGDYTVRFAVGSFWDGTAMIPEPNLISEYFDNTTDFAKAANIKLVAGGSRTGISATLEKGGIISGKVSLPAGEPASSYRGVSVTAWNEFDSAYAAVDPATGNYSLSGLSSGAYTVAFSAAQYFDEVSQTYIEAPNLVSEFYDDELDWASAKKVAVSVGGTVAGINASLAKGATLSGTITAPTGYENIWLSLRSASSLQYAGADASLDENNKYTVKRLAPGDYYVVVGSASSDTAGEQYAQRSGTSSYKVTAPVGGATGVNLTTKKLDAKIEGTATASGFSSNATQGSYLADVIAYQKLDTGWVPSPSRNAAIQKNGSTAYSIPGLAAGTYTVGFEKSQTPYSAASSVKEQWWKNRATLATADAITLAGTKTGVDGTVSPTGSQPPTPSTGFTDVSSTPGSASYSAFATEITWMSGQGISTGYDIGNGKKEYRPFGTVTRDAMAAFLYRAAGSPTFAAPAKSPFTDVSPSSSFYKEITWLANTGITTGWDVGGGKKEFRPFANITRDAMAAFLYRYAGQPAFTAPAKTPFADVPVSNGFYKEITWLASTGISTGWDVSGKKEFRPYNAITRDAMAAFLFRYAHLE
ncbi:S-layer homology domain-containing protein [Microbacterium suwonense]|uniref:S-layer homology domain-containing protein n=1 Tax=Microbacterium suwonense TaxID=683047 RepID=UPI0025722275|nr:S-layer homology domain-containing protein [Microbacterium suwonense]